jgi:hypothetical protein
MKNASLVKAGFLVALLASSSCTQAEFSDTQHIKFLYGIVFLLFAKQFYDYFCSEKISQDEIKTEIIRYVNRLNLDFRGEEQSNVRFVSF